jgi:hypothetical protein
MISFFGEVVMDAAPLILTLLLAEAAQEQFDALRRVHFPADRNLLTAHVTAFHALPGRLLDAVAADVRASAPSGRVAGSVTGVRLIGRGVAYDLSVPHAEAVRAGLARRWHPELTAQDRQGWRPHVTVQNKVAPKVARALCARLTADFVPYNVQAIGWGLFRYRGGPWEHVLSVPFEATNG